VVLVEDGRDLVGGVALRLAVLVDRRDLAPTIFMVRSSTISKLASFWSQKSSHSFFRRRASASARSTILRARASLAFTTSVRCTMRSARARAWSRISSPSRRTLARYSSRSLSSHRASRSSSGRRAIVSSMRSSTSSRLTITEVDRGMGRAEETMSCRRRIMCSTSLPGRRGRSGSGCSSYSS
jgi:hypothetical protein